MKLFDIWIHNITNSFFYSKCKQNLMKTYSVVKLKHKLNSQLIDQTDHVLISNNGDVCNIKNSQFRFTCCLLSEWMSRWFSSLASANREGRRAGCSASHSTSRVGWEQHETGRKSVAMCQKSKIFWQKQKRRKLFPNGTNMTTRLRITQFLSRILRFSPYHPCEYVRKSEDKQKNLSEFTTVCDAGTMINDIVRVSRKWKSFDAKEYYGEIVFGCCRCLGPSRLVLDGARDMHESESAVCEAKRVNLQISCEIIWRARQVQSVFIFHSAVCLIWDIKIVFSSSARWRALFSFDFNSKWTFALICRPWK